MNMKHSLQHEYKSLAQALGDIEFQIYLFTEQRDNLRHQLKVLNEYSPKLEAFSAIEAKVAVSEFKKAPPKTEGALSEAASSLSKEVLNAKA